LNNEQISDYIHIGLGAEHTISQIYKDADLGLLVEYYRYKTLESGKRDDLSLFEVYHAIQKIQHGLLSLLYRFLPSSSPIN